jgi:L-threonylcarbamoyladenylate synthase
LEQFEKPPKSNPITKASGYLSLAITQYHTDPALRIGEDIMKIDICDLDETRLDMVGKIVMGGGIIVYPTDTVYGIGGNPFDPEAVKKIYGIKEREGKPLPVLVSCERKAEELVDLDDVSLFLIREFWPGALTLVLKAKGDLPLELTLGGGTIGLRMPNHSWALKIIEVSNGALIGTSANISGGKPATAVEELDHRIVEKADLIIDGGRSEKGAPSTVLEVYPDLEDSPRGPIQRLRILRKGAVGIDEIMSRLKKGGFGGILVE